eukprot:tig00001366_g8381.t1
MDPRKFDEAKAFLSKSVDNKSSLYDHLSEVLLKVLSEQPANALEQFETISAAIKEASFVPEVIPAEPQTQVLYSKDVERAKENLKLFKGQIPEKHETEREGEEPAEPTEVNECEIPDLMAEAEMFEAGGVGFGREEAFRLALSIKKQLADDPNRKLKKVRLFGKFLGVRGDYFVVEAEPKEWEPAAAPEGGEGDSPKLGPDGQPLVPPEGNGEGTNKYQYWVCSYVGGPWTLLPNVTPQQINVARQIKKFLTGDLKAPVSSYPVFNGTEAEYLRAQIARIAAATVVEPKDKYTLGGDEEEGGDDEAAKEIKLNEEWAPPAPAEQASLENWVHFNPAIRKQGRIGKWDPPKKEKPEGEEGEEGEEEAEEEAAEPEEVVPEPLAPLSADEAIGALAAWAARVSTAFAPQYATVFLKSVRWPGAYAAMRGKQSACIYIGYGHKYTGTTYTPPAPPPVQQEADDAGYEMAHDPTVEEEDAYKEAIEAKNKPEGEGEEGAAEEES